MAGWRKLAVIAGGGELPLALAEHCAGAGLDYYVLRVEPFADAALASHPGASFAIASMGGWMELLRDAGCDAITFLGAVPRPDFATLKFDAKSEAAAAALRDAAGQGDDALLRALIGIFAGAGFQIIGAEEAMADLVAPAGLLGAHAPTPADFTDMAHAANVVAALGALDIGQGAVVCDGLTLAVEAQEGTDAMLRRIPTLPAPVRGTRDSPRGLLLKRPKPGQERRVDLPVIGVATIENAAAAGLAGVAVEAGAALIVRRDAVIAAADAAGLFLFGFNAEDLRRL
jgi:hypothetical protein